MQAELEQTYPRLGTIYSLCSVYYPNIRQRSDVLNRWNFLKTGFYEGIKLLIIDELGFVPLSKTGAELLFEVFSQRYERGSVLVTSNLPFVEWTEVFGSERLTGALLDRLTHHVDILEMKHSKKTSGRQLSD